MRAGQWSTHVSGRALPWYERLNQALGASPHLRPAIHFADGDLVNRVGGAIAGIAAGHPFSLRVSQGWQASVPRNRGIGMDSPPTRSASRRRTHDAPSPRAIRPSPLVSFIAMACRRRPRGPCHPRASLALRRRARRSCICGANEAPFRSPVPWPSRFCGIFSLSAMEHSI